LVFVPKIFLLHQALRLHRPEFFRRGKVGGLGGVALLVAVDEPEETTDHEWTPDELPGEDVGTEQVIDSQADADTSGQDEPGLQPHQHTHALLSSDLPPHEIKAQKEAAEEEEEQEKGPRAAHFLLVSAEKHEHGDHRRDPEEETKNKRLEEVTAEVKGAFHGYQPKRTRSHSTNLKPCGMRT
jgi:hypothetical protein